MLPLGTGLVTLIEAVKYKGLLLVAEAHPVIHICNDQAVFV